MKCEASQELVVGGFTDPQGARVGLGALLVGYYDGDDFVFAGKIGTGFDTQLLLDLRARLDAIEIARVAVHARHAACRGCARTGCVRRSSCRSRSSSGRCTASCGIRGCSASAPTRAARDVVRETAVITHPEKVLFPDDGITKGDLAAYYEAMAPVIAAAPARPARSRWSAIPRASARRASGRRTSRRDFPAWLRARRGAEEGRRRPSSARHRPAIAAVDDQPEHDHAARLGVARRPTSITRTSACSISIRRTTMRPTSARRRSALRDLLDELGLPSLDQDLRLEGLPHRRAARRQDARSARWRAFAHAVGALFVQPRRERLTQEFSKADRGGRIYVDTGRNGYSATFAAPYTVRAKRGAPVSAPCTWEEVERGEVDPRTFTLRNMPERIATVGDLWADLRRRGRSLRQPIEKLRKQIGNGRETAKPRPASCVEQPNLTRLMPRL